MVLLAVRMVADVTETRDVIPSLEFKTCMTIKLKFLLFDLLIVFKLRKIRQMPVLTENVNAPEKTVT